MSFEDDMIEDGFNNEMDYLEYLMDQGDAMQEQMRNRSEYLYNDDCDYAYLEEERERRKSENQNRRKLYSQYINWLNNNPEEVEIFYFESIYCHIENEHSSDLQGWKKWTDNRKNEEQLIQSLRECDRDKLKELIRQDVFHIALDMFVDVSNLSLDEIIDRLLLVKECKSENPSLSEELDSIGVDLSDELLDYQCEIDRIVCSLRSHNDCVDIGYRPQKWIHLIDKLDGINVADIQRIFIWCENGHRREWDKIASMSNLSHIWNKLFDKAYCRFYLNYSWYRDRHRNTKQLWFNIEYKKNSKEFERRAVIDKLKQLKYKGGELFPEGVSIYVEDYDEVVPCCGFIDISGDIIIEPSYDDVKPMFKGYAWVKSGTDVISEYLPEINDYIDLPRGGLWGLINRENDEIVPPKYYYLQDFYCGYSVYGIEVGKKRDFEGNLIPHLKFGIVKYNGEETTGEIYDSISLINNVASKAFKSEDGKAQRKGKCALVTNEGQELTEFIYDDILSFNVWAYIVRVGGDYDEENEEYYEASWGLINCVGEELIPLSTYDSYNDFCEYCESLIPNIDYVKWLKLAAEQGNTDAEYVLGCCYLEGDGVPRSNDKAIEYFQKAANKGELDAQYKLAQCLYDGKNYNIAVNWFQKLAERNFKDSQYYLGLCYFNGLGVTQSYDAAFKCFLQLANQCYGYKEAKYMLGICYAEGKGVEQSYEEAVKWFRRAGDNKYYKKVSYAVDDKPF